MRWLKEAQYLTQERLSVYPRIFILIYVALICAYIAFSNGVVDFKGRPVGTDFIAFWTGSELMLDGSPEAVYDLRHFRAQQELMGGDYAGYNSWHYPPIFHLFTLPLATLPYGEALAVWSLVPLLAYLVVVWLIVKRKESIWLALAFPAVLVNLGHGQTGFLTAALFGGAFLFLDQRPWASGVLIAALAFKPQYGVLIPLVLAISGRWRVFISAALSLCILVATTLVVFGFKTWYAFAGKLPFIGQVLADGLGGYEKMQSVFTALRLWGMGLEGAYTAHVLVALLAVVSVIWVWRQPVRLGVQAAALATGTLLISPYVLDYDLVLLALPIAWLSVEGLRTGFLSWEKTAIVAAWLLPLLSRAVAGALLVPLGPLVIIALMGLILRRVATQSRATASFH